MLFGDMRRKAVGWDLVATEPAEGLTGRDVDALHSTPAYVGCLLYIKGERDVAGGRPAGGQ